MAYARAVKDVFVVAAKRTPFGAFGGNLKNYTPTDLMEFAGRAALQASNINPEIIDIVNIGHVHTEMACGDARIVLTGGTENMSAVPFMLHGSRFGIKLGTNLRLEDRVWEAGMDSQVNTTMGQTAENLAEMYSVTRKDADDFALLSQQRWKAAHDAGIFQDEMAPISIKTAKGDHTFDCDEHPRPNVTKESLAKLPPIFKKNGTVTAGNTCGMGDGAACVILANGEACREHNLTALARVAGYAVAGCDPRIMGIGPVSAVHGLLTATGKNLQDIDLIEVNEAFASQYLAVEKELGLDPTKTNVNGGAIAMSHPVGATGSRITAHLTYALRRKDFRYAVGSACIGGGQGIAVLLENVN